MFCLFTRHLAPSTDTPRFLCVLSVFFLGVLSRCTFSVFFLGVLSIRQEKYDALRQQQLNANDEKATLEERIEKAQQDITQSDHEHKEFEVELDGVGRKHAGRRFAYRAERKTIHDRKNRREGLVTLVRQLKQRVVVLGKEQQAWRR